MDMDRLRQRLGLVLAVGLSLLCSRDTLAQTEEATPVPDILKLIKGANSQERYEALARYYDEQAQKARKEAQNFKAQYECYVEQEKANEKAGIELGPSKLSSLCYRERNQYLDIAKEDDALARIYRQMAEDVGKQHQASPTPTR